MSGEERSNEAPRRSDYVFVPGPESAQIMIDALRSRLAAVERERDELRERLGECIGCNYNDGPDECCPQHGRTITEWIDIASTVIGRQHAIEADRDAALARIAAVEALTEQWDEMLRTCSAIMTTAQRNAWKNALAELRFALAASPTPTGGALQRAENFAAATTPAAAIAALVEGLPGPTPTGPEPECNGSWMTCEKHAPRSRND